MEFAALLRAVGAEPVFETGLLLAGDVRRSDVERQLSRWTRAGRLLQLRRGLYALAPPYQRIEPHPFLVANRLVRGSYVSCQSALAWYGLIPEHVPTVTSVAAQRPQRFETPLGAFVFRHVKRGLLCGYRLQSVASGQDAWVASAEKALLDLIHLQPGGDTEEFLESLRLQHLDVLDREVLVRLADQSRSPKLSRAAVRIAALADLEQAEYERA
jgi:predicted transcriptional regulator of viral defense system